MKLVEIQNSHTVLLQPQYCCSENSTLPLLGTAGYYHDPILPGMSKGNYKVRGVVYTVLVTWHVGLFYLSLIRLAVNHTTSDYHRRGLIIVGAKVALHYEVCAM